MNMENRNGLYVATFCRNDFPVGDIGGHNIWRLNNGKRELVATRSSHISSMCMHNGELYDVGLSGLFKTLKDKEGGKSLIESDRVSYCKALCSHNGELYDAGRGGCFRTFLDDDGKKAGCSTPNDYHVNSLCSFNRELYEGGIVGTSKTGYFTGIYKNSGKGEQNNPVACRTWVGFDLMCVLPLNQRTLSCAGFYPLKSRYENKIGQSILVDIGYFGLFDTLDDSDGRKPLERSLLDGKYDSVEGLCIFDGRLYQANSHGKIYDLFQQKLYYDFNEPKKSGFGAIIEAMVSVE